MLTFAEIDLARFCRKKKRENASVILPAISVRFYCRFEKSNNSYMWPKTETIHCAIKYCSGNIENSVLPRETCSILNSVFEVYEEHSLYFGTLR